MSVTTNYTITSVAQLATDIRAIDQTGSEAAADTAYTFTFDLPAADNGVLTLTQQLDAINLDAGSSLTIIGNDDTISGGGTYNGLFVYGGSVTVDDLAIDDAAAQGGSAKGGGGGGAGLGGGLFVASAATVTLNGVTFASDSATGGSSGYDPASTGGGGLDGGAGGYAAGGGGVGLSASGAATGTGSTTAGSGIIPGAAPGGAGGTSANSHPGTAGGADGGGGGFGAFIRDTSSSNTLGGGGGGGGGGVGGQAGANGSTKEGGKGGAGGFGGGGGAGGVGSLSTSGGGGGNGGFGGGGGPGGDGIPGGAGGNGGFGGGGGGGFGGAGSLGGFGAGNGFSNSSGGGGGGGLGAGGDIFVQQGGKLIIEGGTLGVGTVTGGTGPGGNGEGLGSGLFIQGNEAITLAPPLGTLLSIEGNIADQAGSGGTGTNAAYGTLVIDGAGTVELAGESSAGGSKGGFAGTIDLDDGTLLLAVPGAAGSGVIAFGGADPLLQFTPSDAPTTVISPFVSGDTIEIIGFTETGSSYAGSKLTLDGAGGPVTLSILGKTLSEFAITTTGGAGGNTYITVCYAAGTRIATTDGDRPIETLRPGQLVLALDAAGACVAAPIRWLGRRHLDLASHPDPELAAPVRLRAGALAPGLPRRDLLLSPDHCLLLDGHLLRAWRLINGASVVQDRPSSIEYVHLELDRHALLLAEGVLAETYLEEGRRGFFTGAASVPGPLGERTAQACAPFAPDDTFAERLWRAVAERAGVSPPHVAPAPAPLTLLAGERRLRPIVWGHRHLFTLPHGVREIWLQSPATRPTAARPWAEDRRRLGVRVRGIRLGHERTVPLDAPDFGPGWHLPEPGPVRWTDGNARLALPPRTSQIELSLRG